MNIKIKNFIFKKNMTFSVFALKWISCIFTEKDNSKSDKANL